MPDSSVGCVLLHGFGGRPFEMNFLADCLRAQGYAVRVPFLSGHEGDRRAFDRSRFADWRSSAEEAYLAMRREHDRVALVGFSMGGTLALSLAQCLDPVAVVCIASPIFLCRLYPYWAPDWRLFFSGIISQIVPILPSTVPSPESRAIAPWDGYEGLHHLRPLHSLRVGAAETGRKLFRVRAPLLVIHGEGDRAVHPDNAWTIARGASSVVKEVHLLGTGEQITSGHLLVTHEKTRERLGSLVSRFLANL